MFKHMFKAWETVLKNKSKTETIYRGSPFIKDISIQQYAEASNIYMKGYDKNDTLSELIYWAATNLQKWSMIRDFSVGDFACTKNKFYFYQTLIKLKIESIDTQNCSTSQKTAEKY